MSAQPAYVLKNVVRSSQDVFLTEVLAVLNARPRTLSPRWFYDRRGSELFEAITTLPEYYVTRAECSILAHHAGEIAEITGFGRALIELGSGSSTKTPLLLKAPCASAYVPIDISGEFLQHSAAALAKRFPSENSHKYGPREARTLLRAGGWSPIAEWTDPEGLFALLLASNRTACALVR